MRTSKYRTTRKEKAKLGGLIVGCLLIAVCISGVLMFGKVFALRSVIIEGNTSMTTDEITRLAKLDFGENIFSINTAEIRANVESSGSIAVDDVRVEYPCTVRIQVHERTRSALMLIGGRCAVVDMMGYVVEMSDYTPFDLDLYITGSDATLSAVGSRLNMTETKRNALSAILTALEAQNAKDYFVSIDISNVEKITASTRTGIHVEMGDIQNIEDKIAWAVTTILDLEARGEIHGTLDVSSGNKADYKP